MKHYLLPENIAAGGRIMLFGMFKKVVVADSLAMVADRVFNNVENYCGKVENSFFLKISFKVTNLIFLQFFYLFRDRHRMLTH